MLWYVSSPNAKLAINNISKISTCVLITIFTENLDSWPWSGFNEENCTVFRQKDIYDNDLAPWFRVIPNPPAQIYRGKKVKLCFTLIMLFMGFVLKNMVMGYKSLPQYQFPVGKKFIDQILAPTGAQEVTLSVRPSVCLPITVKSCLDQSIFIFLAQIIKQTSSWLKFDFQGVFMHPLSGI